MTNFGFWQSQANNLGLVLCVTCFETKPREEMYKDEDGGIWDECKDCHES